MDAFQFFVLEAQLEELSVLMDEGQIEFVLFLRPVFKRFRIVWV